MQLIVRSCLISLVVILGNSLGAETLGQPAVDDKGKVFEILDVRFDPIKQGKNVLHVKVKNNSESEQMLKVHIYTRSPDHGKRGVGWGTGFFETIEPTQTRKLRFAYKIQGPVTENTYVKLSVSNPESREQEKVEPFSKKKYAAKDLEWATNERVDANGVSHTTEYSVVDAFGWLKQYIKKAQYEKAWELFSRDYQQSEFQTRGFEAFVKAMKAETPMDAAFHWDKNIFVELKSIHNIRQVRDAVKFNARFDGHDWEITFISEGGKWKLDDMGGYTPQILIWQNWENHILPRMKKHSTEHFDIHFWTKSTAAKEIGKIAEQKEQGYKKICEFLGKESDTRIRLVFFESKQQKHWKTGHQGMGWAYGNTIVEVYNEKEQLDPYHETTHVLMRDVGYPPAIFNEGFAVYMSERLGAHALEDLSGGKATIHERTQELNRNGQLISLSTLVTYTEIGSPESNPPIAYPQAASFVKFLIDSYGKDKFLKSYRELRDPGNKLNQWNNTAKLAEIYGQSFKKLEEHWLAVISYPTKLESIEKLRRLNNLLELYVVDNNGMLPEVLQNLNPYEPDKDYFAWLLNNITYLGTSRRIDSKDSRPFAYDKTLLQSHKTGTNALLPTGEVEWTDAHSLTDLRTAKAREIESRYAFAIFATKQVFSGYGANTIHPDIVEVEDQPVISADDIIEYNWDSHTIKLKPGVREKLPQRPDMLGHPFVVVADGKRCYLGAFWSVASSIPSSLPVIVVFPVPVPHVDPNSITIEPYHKDSIAPPIPEVRNDPRVYKALRKLGKFKEKKRLSSPEDFQKSVDLSMLSPEMEFQDAVAELKRRASKPIEIVVLWKDISNNAYIDRDTPIGMDPISGISLKTALDLLLTSVASEKGVLDYRVMDGIIVIATKQTLAKYGPETRVYDITDLAQPPANYRVRNRY